MFLRPCLTCAVLLLSMAVGVPQTRSSQQRTRKPVTKTQPPPVTTTPPAPPSEAVREPSPEPTPPAEEQEVEKIKVDTDLVTIPVIATSLQGNYIPDLRQEEFSITEDGTKQQIAFFASVSAPFHVVLLLDTSASTEEKLGTIRKAAGAFVDQLQAHDRVKVISFDNDVRDLTDFTNDRSVLKAAINQSPSGAGTKLYDAFELALSSIRPIQGRKAIVVFTDGVDWRSDMATFESSLHGLDEDGVIVYPIRYETRAETERIARDSSNEPSSGLPTIDVVRAPGTTPTTFPSDEPSSVPTSSQRRTGPFGLPSAADILRGRRDPNTDQLPPSDRLPPTDPTGRPDRDPGDVGGRPGTTRPTGSNRRSNDSIGLMLDGLYMKADSYLLELANRSGGRIVRADTLGSLPDAFARIAAELRTQYAISYYPINKAHDGQYRKVKVSSTRKDAVIRARPGYRTSTGRQ